MKYKSIKLFAIVMPLCILFSVNSNARDVAFLVKKDNSYYIKRSDNADLTILVNDLDPEYHFLKFMRDSTYIVEFTNERYVDLEYTGTSSDIALRYKKPSQTVGYRLNREMTRAYKYSFTTRTICGDSVALHTLFYDTHGNITKGVEDTMQNTKEMNGVFYPYYSLCKTKIVNGLYFMTYDGQLYLCQDGQKIPLGDRSFCDNVHPIILCGYRKPSISSDGKSVICEFHTGGKVKYRGSIVEIDILTKEEKYYSLGGKKPQYSEDSNLIVYEYYSKFSHLKVYEMYDKENNKITEIGKYDDLWCMW